jgi:hypothetical protein
MPRGSLKHRYCFFADTPNIGRTYSVTVFEKIYDGEPILTVVSNIGEDVQNLCFNLLYDVKSVLQPDTMPILENNYCLQMIEKGFAE